MIVDEVYQNNIYKPETLPFYSFRKVLNEMPTDIKKSVEMVSYNSISKGFMGECGIRGGYMEVLNIDKYALSQLDKMMSMNSCGNTVG